jgi:3-hydroxyisobutyrate dehydrogenase-like beta-hydroxyacid dehydrogenase
MAGGAVSTVGFLGAGQLGTAMVERLVDAGHDVYVYARRAVVRAHLDSAGASVADSVAAVAAESDVLISCLFSDEQLHEIGMGPRGFIANAKPGSVFVSHTTGALGTLLELADASPRAPIILDAPVSGTADDIRGGHLTVLLGGSADAVERVGPVLGAYADPVLATGALGTALAIKLINNTLFAANAQLAASAIALGRDLNVDPGSLLAALAVCSGGSTAASHMQRIGGVDAFADLAVPFLRKDVGALADVAADLGFGLGLVGSVVDEGPLPLIVR